MVAPQYFSGRIEFGVITQSSSAFGHILNDVSFLINQYETLASFTAIIDRLGQFDAELDRCAMLAERSPDIRISIVPDANAALATRHLSISSPFVSLPDGGGINADSSGDWASVNAASSSYGGQNLLQDLNWEVKKGEAWLVMGESGAGKTTLLRALAGLWDNGSGSVELSSTASDAMFVPQRPYLVLGTLRDQLLYPRFQLQQADGTNGTSAAQQLGKDGNNDAPVEMYTSKVQRATPSDDELIAMLASVRLHRLASKAQLDTSTDWSTQLSLGEQQRLAFARVLLAEPSLALFDESTSALDVPAEHEMYRLLREKRITIVSVGHRPTLAQLHDYVLRLHGPQAHGWWDTFFATDVAKPSDSASIAL